jgi:hypothetical protein
MARQRALERVAFSRGSRGAIAVPAVLFVVTGVIAIALLDHGTTEPLGSTLAIGILASLEAAAIVSVIRVVSAVRSEP